MKLRTVMTAASPALGTVASSLARGALALGIALSVAGAGVVAQPAEAYAASNLKADQIATGVYECPVVEPSAKVQKPNAKQLKAFKKASADFAVELLQKATAAKGKNANVTVAPLSVMSALAVTANGAAGKTSAQLRDVLGDGASMTRINKNLAWYNSKLVDSKKARLLSANSVWYHDAGTLKMKKSFLGKAQKYYGAQVTGADFDDPATVKAVNGWVAGNTNNMIKKIVDQMSADDRVAIVNALYFEADWRVPYDKYDTVTRKFTNANGKKKRVKMMYGTEQRYIEGKNVTGFIKPYAKGYSYVALLPKKGMSAKKYVQTLDGDTLRKLIAGAKKTPVRTALPKYSVSYSNENLASQLKAMGVKDAFGSKADFTKMGTDPTGKLYIGAVVHKTKVQVDEKGTKAAAATGVVMKATSAIFDAKTVTLNRPFVYAIVDNATKLPVFVGTVSNIGK